MDGGKRIARCQGNAKIIENLLSNIKRIAAKFAAIFIGVMKQKNNP